MAHTLTLVNAFAELPFQGNPAAVCILDREREADWLQRIAGELNQPTTAFVLPEETGYQLRWFHPTGELEFCGHATLASAHVLFEMKLEPKGGAIDFETKGGPLTVRQRDPWLVLEIPSQKLEPIPPPESGEAVPGLAEALGCSYWSLTRTPYDVLIDLASEDAVKSIQPNFALLATLPGRGFIVTAPSDSPDADFVSRFFAPRLGIDEDPVTGSAHAALAPFWGERLGKSSLTGRQLSRRGGLVRVENDADHVALFGKAVSIFEGQLRIS